ncbi:MAG: type I glyceraldehyde-3-phosphate dehydrogenase [Oligoflexia bacterium]|nr:type I glyceraldehyde-3-phosphate dehydrogenase [Oligoflexia bacterium]
MEKPTLRIAVNGLGRIGRLIVRLAYKKLNLALINGTNPSEKIAYFLKYDSIHGVWPYSVSSKDQGLVIEGESIACLQEKHPDLIPWDRYKIDVVVECTGKFKNREDWGKAFSKGVKKVIVSAPSQTADFTLLYGVNQNQYQADKHHFISNASCTTNCLAPLIQVLKQSCGVERGFFSTVHSYTNDQRLLDSSHKDLRRSRSAGLNIIPTSTGAGQALSLIFPELKNRLQGLAYRVPTANVSLVDLMVETKKTMSLEELHHHFHQASLGRLKGILAIEESPLVSSDFIGRKESAVLDTGLSRLQDQKLLKLVAWYDNEMGFSQRIIDFISSSLS